MKADTIVVQGRSLHYNLLQYVLDNIRDTIKEPYKFILKSQLNKTKHRPEIVRNIFTLHNEYVHDYRALLMKNLPKHYEQIKIGGKEDGMPEGSIKVELGKYFKHLNVKSIESTANNDENLLVFHQPNEKIGDNISKIFKAIRKNKNHELTKAVESEFGNGKTVEVGALMSRYNSSGYTSIIY